MRYRPLAWLTAVVLTGSALTAQAQDAALDYPQWRGAQRDGVAAAFVEPASWPVGLTRQWQAETGLGYATPILVGDHVYTFGRLDTDEVIMALDADTGAIVWRTTYAAPFRDNAGVSRHGPGPKSTLVLQRCVVHPGYQRCRIGRRRRQRGAPVAETSRSGRTALRHSSVAGRR